MSRLMQFLAWCFTGAFASAMVALWPVGGPADILAWSLAWLVAWAVLKLALRRRLGHAQAGTLGLMVAVVIFALLHLGFGFGSVCGLAGWGPRAPEGPVRIVEEKRLS